MKFNLLLTLLISGQNFVFAEDQNRDQFQNQQPEQKFLEDHRTQQIKKPFFNGYEMGMPFGTFGKDSESIKVEDYPLVSVKLNGSNESIDCKLDSAAKIYICPNNILLKSNILGFTALGRDEKNAPKLIAVRHVESNEKVLFETPIYAGNTGGYPGITDGGISSSGEGTNAKPVTGLGIHGIRDLNYEVNNKITSVESFFELGPYFTNNANEKRVKGSDELEKIIASFIAEKDQFIADIREIYREKKYQVELQDGTKINCVRGNTRALNEVEKKNDTNFGISKQCGSFKCDKVLVNGNEYQPTLIYESAPNSLNKGSVHLIDKNGIGPTTSLRKIFSDKSKIPLVDNSFFLDNPNNAYMGNYISELLPVSLKEDRQKISRYKDPGLKQFIEYYKNICDSDNDGGLAHLVTEKNKLVAKLADLELAEFIQVLGDGILVGQFVDPTLAPELGCLYNGVYLNDVAARNLDRIKKNIHPDKKVDQTISFDKANELFNKAVGMKDIAWKYKPDGCYARAHLMARRFEAEGVRVDKVWIKGDLYVPGTEPLILWNFHVAPIVYVEDGKGKIQKMVIDPSLFERPVTVEEWDNKMSKNTIRGSSITAFPFPENSAMMERSTLSFSSSDPYLPRENINLSEEEKIKMSNDTMKMYKQMEPQ